MCEECGSIQVFRDSASAGEAVLVLFGRQPVKCRRCGWRALRRWTDEQLVQNTRRSLIVEDEADRSLDALDGPRREIQRRSSDTETPDEFDFESIERGSVEPAAIDVGAERQAEPRRRIRARRRSRQPRREIFAAIAITCGALAVILLSGGSCNFRSPE